MSEDDFVNKTHQTCKHFKQTVDMTDMFKIEYCDECLNGHNLFSRTGKNCEDYRLERCPTSWGRFIIDYENWGECMDCKHFEFHHEKGSPKVKMSCKRLMSMEGFKCYHFIPDMSKM